MQAHMMNMQRQSMSGGGRHNSVSGTQILEQLQMSNTLSCDERIWLPNYLYRQFRTKNTETLYKRYEQRYLLSNFFIYLMFQSLISFGVICVALTMPETYCYSSSNCRYPSYIYKLDLSLHTLIVTVSLFLGLAITFGEDRIKTFPWTLYVASVVSMLTIEIVDAVNVFFATKEEINIYSAGNSTSAYRNYQTIHGLMSSQDLSPGYSLARELDDSFPQGQTPHHLPVLSLYNLIYVYLFLPISRKDVSVCLGITVSIITITITSISNYWIDTTFSLFDPKEYSYQLAADITFHICVNLIGWYVKYVGNINMRRGFLDKRSCIETTHRLDYEKGQEENLVLSIIPKHIASRVGEEVSQFLSNLTNEGGKTEKFNETFIETYKNVTILYADICGFTPLTEKFTVKQVVDGKEVTVDRIEDLVATLNDLFGKFDEAADRHNCQRIKILGDCYYCIAGVPMPDADNKDAPAVTDPNHARNSVEMGLDMITLIGEVRAEHGVPVNMRIGVHTGNILSGLIGLRKWQFDIWSNDTVIANHMESSGSPGRVHITESTKQQLGDTYKYDPVTSMDDEVILKSGLQTYLVRTGREAEIERQFSQDSGMGSNENTLPKQKRSVMIQDKAEVRTYERTNNSNRRSSVAPSGGPPRRSSIAQGGGGRRGSKMFGEEGGRRGSKMFGEEESSGKGKKSSAMDTSLKGFQRIMGKTEQFMEEEIEQLPIRIQDRWFSSKKKQTTKKATQIRNSNSQINHVFLCFKNMEWYKEYLQEHDPLFKWYILASFIILNGMGIILILTSFTTRPHIVLWILYMVIYTVLLALIPCTWISFIWDQIIDPEFDLENIEQPENRLINSFYQVSGKISTSVKYRSIIFIFIGIMTALSSVLDLIITPCMAESPRNYTYRCALSIMAFFMFLRVPHIFKTILCIVCLGFYSLIIFGVLGQGEVEQNPRTFFSTESFGYEIYFTSLDSRYQSHIVFLVGIFVYFFLLDRQNEFIHLLDYQWKRQLKDDQEKQKQTKLVNKMLLQNILPQHVANVFLSSDRESGKLFSESYQNVAVMFASLPNYVDFFTEADEKKPLNILHEIVSMFDQIMYEPQFNNRIEKIKIIGSTFMAASGLVSGRKSSSESDSDEEAFTKGQNARTLAKFTAAMMRSLKEMDYDKFELKSKPDFKLRVGICAGKVIAGVVGDQKPVYDIWGDTVNTAARMDYFTVKGKIHVPQATARHLMNLDQDGEKMVETDYGEPLLNPWIECELRGDIKVKGKGMMTTYHIALTEDLYLVEHNIERDYKDDMRSVSRNNSYEPHQELEDQQKEDESDEGDDDSTNSVKRRRTISNSLEDQLSEMRDKYESEQTVSMSTEHSSSRSNSRHSSCPSTDTSSVLMDMVRSQSGVSDTDIVKLREWLSINRVDSI